MLKLSNNDQIKAAAKVLQSVSPKVTEDLEGRPVCIRLTGLACMRGSPEKAYVVHAPLKVTGGEAQLEHACQRIINAFTEAGLVLEEDVNKKLKLHATIMNARYRKSKKSSEKTDPFDARAIFAQYGSEEWGECRIREVHLSKRFVYDINGYFHCCASIPFPEEKQGESGIMKNIFHKESTSTKHRRDTGYISKKVLLPTDSFKAGPGPKADNIISGLGVRGISRTLMVRDARCGQGLGSGRDRMVSELLRASMGRDARHGQGLGSGRDRMVSEPLLCQPCLLCIFRGISRTLMVRDARRDVGQNTRGLLIK
ncbi:hypothetical protein BC332_06007 [Capsicum chinense]|nr:hypothetical protein BC332_06007 [Capsicum chinense]